MGFKFHAKLIRTGEWEAVHRVLNRFSNGEVADAARSEMDKEMEDLARKIRESIENQTFEGAGVPHSEDYAKRRKGVGILYLTGDYKNSIKSIRTGADNWTVKPVDGHIGVYGSYIPNEQLAAILEYGGADTPPRPHWQGPIDEAKRSIEVNAKGTVRDVAYKLWKGK